MNSVESALLMTVLDIREQRASAQAQYDALRPAVDRVQAAKPGTASAEDMVAATTALTHAVRIETLDSVVKSLTKNLRS